MDSGLQPVTSESPDELSGSQKKPREDSVYDSTFWLSYAANALTTLANGLLFRYSDYVNELGGDEKQLGLIVGVGMIGSIAIRVAQGEAIDRYGAGRIWRVSIMVYSVSLLLHLLVTTAYSPAAFLARVLMQSGLAGFFGSSITFVSLRVPPQKMAEVVGALGTSGFLGLMLGPLLGDWLGRAEAESSQQVRTMFLTAAVLASASTVMTFLAVRGTERPVHHPRPSLIGVIHQHRPVMIWLSACVMGAGFAIPATFLRPFAVEYNLSGIGVFFFVYALTGFGARIASRSVFERFGNRPWIVAGLILLTVSYLCYVPVTKTWQLVFPAVVAGCAHALLFPSIMSAGTAAFPRQYLGVATSLTLAMFDVGTLVAAPMIGVFLSVVRPHTRFAYTWMFAGVAIIFGLVTMAFIRDQTHRTPAA